MKTTEEALKLAEIIKKETDSLPKYNFFGDDNSETIAECRAWVKALHNYAKNGRVPLDADLEEVRQWIRGRNSMLNDYEQ